MTPEYEALETQLLVWQVRAKTAEVQVMQLREAQAVVATSDLLVMAVEDGVIRMSQVMDVDLQDALEKFVRRFAAAPAAPAVAVPPMMTPEQIESNRQWACDWGVLNKHPAGRFAARLIDERDKQWLAALGVRG